MSIKHIIYLSLVLFASVLSQAQEFNVDEQYKQSMANAKMALEAKQYSQAVLFYREALSLKPSELLPKYKIEDIRTIYIKKELDSLIAEVPIVIPPKGKKKKKEAEKAKIELEQKAEEVATLKMNQEVEIVKEELVQLKIEAELLEITDTTIELTEDEIIPDMVPNRESGISEIESKEVKSLKGGISPSKGILTVEQRTLPVIEKPIEPKAIVEEKPIRKETKSKVVVQPKIDKPIEKNKEWIEKENKRLVVAYPNKKTVEEIEKPGKHITRVVMNINNRVTIYLKVKHSWGATFFFKDEVGLELISISQTYFNLMTNLETYEKH